MSLMRAKALRSLQTGLRPAFRHTGPRRTQLLARRWASTGGGHGAHAQGSDLPWFVSAVAVTIPSCWYLWPEGKSVAHHGAHNELEGDHAGPGEEGHAEQQADEEAAEEKSEEGGEEQTEEAPPAGEAPKDDEAPKDEEPPKDDAPKDDSPAQQEPDRDTSDGEEADKESEETAKPSGTDGDSQPASNDANKKSTGQEPAEPREGSSGKRSENPMKGMIKGAGAEDTRKREPDSKGGFKKRVDSGLGKNLGEGPSKDEDGRETAATSKTPQKGSEGDISGKQFGLSTTATRHSTQIDQDPEKSKKGEGTPETAKSMGTVDPNRNAR